MRRLFLCLCYFMLLSLQPTVAAAATSLSPGDLALVGFNADNPDELAFVLLTDISTGTELHFTDRGWLAAGGFRSGEGTFTWTADQPFPRGSVIQPNVSGIALSSAGDQIFVFQGDAAQPTLLFGLNAEGEGWQTDATNANSSALPHALTAGLSAIALPEVDNAVYSGPTSGTPDVLRTALTDPQQWQGSNSVRQMLPSTPFTVQSPTVVTHLSSRATVDTSEWVWQLGALLALSGLSLLVLRTRRVRRPLGRVNGRLAPAPSSRRGTKPTPG